METETPLTNGSLRIKISITQLQLLDLERSFSQASHQLNKLYLTELNLLSKLEEPYIEIAKIQKSSNFNFQG